MFGGRSGTTLVKGMRHETVKVEICIDCHG